MIEWLSYPGMLRLLKVIVLWDFLCMVDEKHKPSLTLSWLQCKYEFGVIANTPSYSLHCCKYELIVNQSDFIKTVPRETDEGAYLFFC